MNTQKPERLLSGFSFRGRICLAEFFMPRAGVSPLVYP